MLDGLWRVYLEEGNKFLGQFSTRIGNDVLILNQAANAKVSIGTRLLIYEVYGKKSWLVTITGPFKDFQYEYVIQKIKDIPPYN